MNISYTKIVKDPLLKRIIKSPFKYYFKAASVTFGLVATTNLFTTLIPFKTSNVKFNNLHDDRRKLLKSYPQIYFITLLTKSAYFGLIWPACYFTLFTNPKDVMLLGNCINTESVTDVVETVTDVVETVTDAIKTITDVK